MTIESETGHADDCLTDRDYAMGLGFCIIWPDYRGPDVENRSGAKAEVVLEALIARFEHIQESMFADEPKARALHYLTLARNTLQHP